MYIQTYGEPVSMASTSSCWRFLVLALALELGYDSSVLRVRILNNPWTVSDATVTLESLFPKPGEVVAV
jgi:hypothetical protein